MLSTFGVWHLHAPGAKLPLLHVVLVRSVSAEWRWMSKCGKLECQSTVRSSLSRPWARRHQGFESGPWGETGWISGWREVGHVDGEMRDGIWLEETCHHWSRQCSQSEGRESLSRD